jgi:hypothetical protein
MDESHSGPDKKWKIPGLPPRPETKSQHALKAEEKILQAISARAPVPETLNEICSALDCQIGNSLSLISTSTGRDTSAAGAARTAARFGMHVFSSAKIIDDLGGELGSLETYCRDSRIPSSSESQLIHRATQLAAYAITREKKAIHRAKSRISENAPVRRRVLEWPVS